MEALDQVVSGLLVEAFEYPWVVGLEASPNFEVDVLRRSMDEVAHMMGDTFKNE